MPVVKMIICEFSKIFSINEKSVKEAYTTLKGYQHIDKEYSLSRVKGKLSFSLAHKNQVEAVLALSNGDVAISGGPKYYEVIIYKVNLKGNQFEFVSAINTSGVQVRHLLEFKGFLILGTVSRQFRVYCPGKDKEAYECKFVHHFLCYQGQCTSVNEI